VGATAGLSSSAPGVAPPEFTPKDSFDPEIFNSRYFKPTTTDGSSGSEKSSGGK